MKTKDTFPTAIDYLGAHEKVANLIHAAHQLTKIQNDCSGILPGYFSGCSVMKMENGTLFIGVPNQATAARLRQKLPLLQNSLGRKGWPVQSIRLKIRFPQNPFTDKPADGKRLSPKAYESFMELHEKLEKDRTSTYLTAALSQLISNYRPVKR